MKYLPLIWAGLSRKKARTVFTVLSILVAFLLFGLLQGIDEAFNSGVQGANLDRLYVQNKVSFTVSLPLSYLPQIQKVPGVVEVAYATWFGGYYRDTKHYVTSFPVDADRYFMVFPEYRLSAEERTAFSGTRSGIVVGAGLAKKYGWKAGDHIPLKSTIWTKTNNSSDWDFEIVGIFTVPADPSREEQLFINAAYFDEARGFGKGTTGWFVVRLSDPRRITQIGQTIDQMFANSPDETKTVTEKENQQSFLRQLGDISFMVGAIIDAVFFTLLFLTGNTMMQSVRERIPEFAILKTLGYSDGRILALVAAESAAVTLLPAIIGLAASTALFPILPLSIGIASLPVQVIAAGICYALALAALSTFLPGWRIRRTSIVDALAGR